MAAAPTVPLISEEGYLNTSYEYTTEYVEVHLVGPDGMWVQLSPPLTAQLPLPNGTLTLDFDDMFARL